MCILIWFLKRILLHNCSIIVNENEEFLKNGSRPVLLIESKGHALHAFANQELQGFYFSLSLWVFFFFLNQVVVYGIKGIIIRQI